jgi:hypothetical protein
MNPLNLNYKTMTKNKLEFSNGNNNVNISKMQVLVQVPMIQILSKALKSQKYFLNPKRGDSMRKVLQIKKVINLIIITITQIKIPY